MNLTTFDGEYLSKATGQIKMAIQRLKTIDQIPKETNRHILDVLQTSTISKF